MGDVNDCALQEPEPDDIQDLHNAAVDVCADSELDPIDFVIGEDAATDDDSIC